MVESARRTSRSNFQKRGIEDKIDLVMEDLIQVKQNNEDTIIKCSKEVKSIYIEFLEYNLNELEFLDVKEKSLPKDEPDYWEKLKHQYAGMAMQGLLSNSAYLENFVKYSVKGDSLIIVVTANAIDYATALVNRLKEESQCEK